MYDFIVVGARCAGAATAAFLAARGYRILVVDQFAAPGPTISTHLIGETDIYDRLRVSLRMEASGIPEMTRMRVDLAGRVFEADIAVTPRALSVRRELLDGWLLEELANYPNVEVRLRTKVDSLIRGNGAGETIGVSCQGPDGRAFSAFAHAVVGADGRHSAVARSAEAEIERQSDAHHLAVCYAYVRDLVPLAVPTVEWYWLEEGIALCNPLDRSLHCVAVMLPEPMIKQEKLWRESEFLARLRQIRTLAPRLGKASLAGPIRGIGKTASRIRRPYGERWALVGDAGAYLHPVAGTGIDNAVCTAEWLAEELDRWLKGDKSWQEAMEAYAARRDERVVPQYEHCLRTLANAERSAEAGTLAKLDLLCTFPSLIKELARRSEHVYSTLMEGLAHD